VTSRVHVVVTPGRPLKPNNGSHSSVALVMGMNNGRDLSVTIRQTIKTASDNVMFLKSQ
jgi:hypothetical protein